MSPDPLTQDERLTLLRLARQSLEHRAQSGRTATEKDLDLSGMTPALRERNEQHDGNENTQRAGPSCRRTKDHGANVVEHWQPKPGALR